MLTEYAELIVKVNETGPGEGVTPDGLAHGISGLEFVSKAEHIQATIAVLVVDGDDVAGVADAGRAPRGPANDERQLILVVFRGADLLPIYCAHIVVVVLSSANLITHSLLLGDTLMHGVVRIDRGVLAVVNVKHSGKARVIEMKALEPPVEFEQETEHRVGFVVVKRPLVVFVLQFRHLLLVVLVQFLIGRHELLFGGLLHSVPRLILLTSRLNVELIVVEPDGHGCAVLQEELSCAEGHSLLHHLAEVHDVPPLYLRILHVALKASVLQLGSQRTVLRVFAIAVYP